MTKTATLTFFESDIIKLILEFLDNRELCISQLSLERETGCNNGMFSEDMLFLRQLILDGQWDQAQEFLQPLKSVPGLNMKSITFTLLKHKFLELLCIKTEGDEDFPDHGSLATDEVLQCLEQMRDVAPDQTELRSLTLLISLPRLDEHPEYMSWNPSLGRVHCFKAVFPLLEPFLRLDTRGIGNGSTIAKQDRLLQLLIKGLLYESAVELCQSRATGGEIPRQMPGLLDETGFSDADHSLISWLTSVPATAFQCPFEQRSLAVDVRPLARPSLEASWAQQILVTPIKPKMFPYSHMPPDGVGVRRHRAELLTRSMIAGVNTASMNGWTSNRATPPLSDRSVASGRQSSLMTRSMAGFHLSATNNNEIGVSAMQRSVDRLFVEAANSRLMGNDVRMSMTASSAVPPTIAEEEPLNMVSQSSTAEGSSLQLSSASTNVAAGTLDDEEIQEGHRDSAEGDLFRAFQRQRNELQHELLLREREQAAKIIELEQRNQEMLQRLERLSMSSEADKSESEFASGAAVVVTSGQRTNVYHTPPDGSPSHPSKKSLSGGSGGLVDTSVLAPRVSSRAPTVSSSRFSGASSGGLDGSSNIEAVQQHQRIRSRSQITNNNNNNAVDKKVNSSSIQASQDAESQPRPHFVAVTSLEDAQAIRSVAFHPHGHLYAIGSNSKTLRVCKFPDTADVEPGQQPTQTAVLFNKARLHKGSVYCTAWSLNGDLLATGSNDKTVRLMAIDPRSGLATGRESELAHHDGTVRDVTFMQDLTSGAPLLLSGGAGDCRVYVTDCLTGAVVRACAGHTGHVYSLHSWSTCLFASGSADKTCRLWDLRSPVPVQIVASPCASAYAAVAVDPSGRLLASGHEDASVVLLDIRGNRHLNAFRPHSSDVRSVRFSANSFYLLTGSYDGRIVLTDLHGDLCRDLPHVTVAEHRDKVIQCRWHPQVLAFVSTSADRTATCWALPPI